MLRRIPLLNGQPDCFTFVLGLDDFLFQAVNPDAAVEHFADFAVLAYEDAAFGIFRAVAGMDADALKFWHSEQDGKPLFELRTPRDHHSIAAFRNRRATFHFIRPVLVVAPSGFEGVAEILVLCSCQILVIYAPLNVEPTYCVGLAFCYTF